MTCTYLLVPSADPDVVRFVRHWHVHASLPRLARGDLVRRQKLENYLENGEILGEIIWEISGKDWGRIYKNKVRKRNEIVMT